MQRADTEGRRLRPLLPESRDVLLLGYLPVVALLACTVPPRRWMPLCEQAARFTGYAGRQRAQNVRDIARVLAGHVPADAPPRIAAQLGAHHHHVRMHMLRCLAAPQWRPRTELVGREHLDAALAGGRGAVLWVAPMVYASLLGKMALHGAGYRVTHLGGPRHGFSASDFGARVLNPPWIAVESRFLAAWADLSRPAVLAELLQRLRANQLVSIAMGPNGRRRHVAPLLAERAVFANGAAALAQRTGAPLLPVFTARRADGCVVTAIEGPLALPPDLDADAAEQRLVAYGAQLLESWVLRHPDQFNGWRMTDPAAM